VCVHHRKGDAQEVHNLTLQQQVKMLALTCTILTFTYADGDIKGYNKGDHPVLGQPTDQTHCPHCLCTPCVVAQPPDFLVGSSAASLNNVSKRYSLYRKFWGLLRQLGVWEHPTYLERKGRHTHVDNKRDVMPDCLTKVCRPYMYACLELTKCYFLYIQEIRRRFPNPEGIPYTDFQGSFMA